MVLCVSKIHRSPPNEDQGKVVQVKPYLELTDGWYRICAEVDDCLSRAIDKGRIAVGRKLALAGAKVS
jgi:breast cancer 2 susceptibility protein